MLHQFPHGTREQAETGRHFTSSSFEGPEPTWWDRTWSTAVQSLKGNKTATFRSKSTFSTMLEGEEHCRRFFSSCSECKQARRVLEHHADSMSRSRRRGPSSVRSRGRTEGGREGSQAGKRAQIFTALEDFTQQRLLPVLMTALELVTRTGRRHGVHGEQQKLHPVGEMTKCQDVTRTPNTCFFHSELRGFGEHRIVFSERHNRKKPKNASLNNGKHKLSATLVRQRGKYTTSHIKSVRRCCSPLTHANIYMMPVCTPEGCHSLLWARKGLQEVDDCTAASDQRQQLREIFRTLHFRYVSTMCKVKIAGRVPTPKCWCSSTHHNISPRSEGNAKRCRKAAHLSIASSSPVT